MELPKRYEAKETEEKWTQKWEQDSIYTYNEEENKTIYSIDTPPPTVSGAMHIGHSFSYAQGDFIARYKRMSGHKVFYPFGTDDNGLPTDKLVEKTKKVKAKRMARGEYLELAHQTIKELRPQFIQDWKDLGMSCDFTQPYSTISPEVQKTSQKGFIDLYKKGYVYRKESPVSWCPQCQSAIAQAEFENTEMASSFNDILFTTKNGEELTIATTRPELLPSCVGLFYHPEDERYTQLAGKFATVPLFDYEVPILTDESVDKEKGTGLMMCCTFGDKEDIEKWHKHHLPLRTSFTLDGKMNEDTGKYSGMPLREARKVILTDLEEQGKLLTSKKILHPVNVHERDGVEVEYMVTPQWYVNVLDHKQQLITAADNIIWHPKHMKTRYLHWVENLGWDWCISRQRHFGIPFPVWYEKDTGNIILADESQLPIDPLVDKPLGYTGNPENLVPETDVLDTWATSSLTPHIALGWAENKTKAKEQFPMSIRMQAHDIIRTWAFYTITRGMYHEQKVPWKNIMISGFVLDPKGNKMSKSKGNVIKPQDVMGKFCADALRYWAAGSKLGDDLPYMEKDVQTGMKTVNKLWNASKFTLMNLERYDGSKPEELQTIDNWLLSKLSAVVQEATQALEHYAYAKAKASIDHFFWNSYCDYYLEIVKKRLYSEEAELAQAKKSAQYAMNKTLETVLKIFAPFMPYITEELWTYFKPKAGSIHVSAWPQKKDYSLDEKAMAAGDLLITLISAIRKKKSEAQVSLRAPITKLTLELSEKNTELLSLVENDVKDVTNTTEIVYATAQEEVAEGIKMNLVLGEPEKKE